MTQLARIASHVFNVPLLVRLETAMTVANVLFERDGASAFTAEDFAAEMSRFRGQPSGPQRTDGSRATYYRVENGIAVIPVLGELCNRGAWIGASSGLTSYEGLAEQLRAVAADSAVRGAVLDMNSPGGEAFGAFEAGAAVQELAAKKPVVAFVNGMACSAAYAIACGADEIVCIPSGIVGSIGVIMMHMDRSAALAKAGLKPTVIHAGAHKADLSSLRELPDDARARLQAHVDETYGLFVSTVAEARELDPDAVRATEGGVLMGQSAVAAGLADRTGTLDDCFALIDSAARSRAAFTLGATMDTIAVAAHEAALSAAREEGARAAATAASNAQAAAQVRIGAILGCKEAKGREATAQHLALSTDMTAVAAAALLATMPEAAAPRDSRMSRAPNPSVQPDRGEADAPDHDAMWGDAVSAANKAAGVR